MTLIPSGDQPFLAAIHRDRLARAARDAVGHGIEALLVTPSPDYAYLLGYRAPAMERLTCLVLTADGPPRLVLPRLEAPLALHELGDLADHVELVEWDETDDPFRLVQELLRGTTGRIGVQDQMWARFVLRFQAMLEPVQLVPAGHTLSALRSVKGPDEVERLRSAASAADQAMLAITGERLSGRSEEEVSAHIRQLLLDAGHDTADFAIVGSGPNSASPHHEAGERVIQPGDAIVLDIGGTRGGYCSDTTRTAFVGEPPAEFAELYRVLEQAQAAACEAVAPGVAPEDVDAAARRIIDEAGYGEYFIHRTGHGIGMETHEEPYIVRGNREPLQPGNAFSIEPGIYLDGRWGARIEDIVICTEDGGELLNLTPRTLYVVA
jgi:Xaa-Pro aminopeptidase